MNVSKDAIYSNFFYSHEEATHKLINQPTKTVYSSLRWLQRLNEFNQQVTRKSQDKEILSPRNSSLPIFLAAQDKGINILDLGGGGGWLGIYLRLTLSKIKVYDIIEIPAVERYFRDKIIDYKINYVNYIGLQKYDILYSNSCIQYLESNLYLLNIAAKTRPKYIILDDLYISQKSQFFCHQKYYDQTLIMRFLDREEIINSFSSLNYSLIYSGAYSDPILNQNNTLLYDKSVLKDWRPESRKSFIMENTTMP